MRRVLLIVGGIAVVLLWWQPWRRWLQQQAAGGEGGWHDQTPGSPYNGNYDASSNWQSPNTLAGTGAAAPSTRAFGTETTIAETATERYTVTDPQNADPIASDDTGDSAASGAMPGDEVFDDGDATIEQGEAALLASDAPPAFATGLSADTIDEFDTSVETTGATDLLPSNAPPALDAHVSPDTVDDVDSTADTRAESDYSIESTLTDLSDAPASTPSDTALNNESTAPLASDPPTDEAPIDMGAGSSTTEEAPGDSDMGAPSNAAPDDLIIIEGVGPKISTVLTAAGITSFAQMAEAGAERLSEIVRDAGITTANTSTWPEQARLAAEGKMDELQALQQRIKNGKLTE